MRESEFKNFELKETKHYLIHVKIGIILIILLCVCSTFEKFKLNRQPYRQEPSPG